MLNINRRLEVQINMGRSWNALLESKTQELSQKLLLIIFSILQNNIQAICTFFNHGHILTAQNIIFPQLRKNPAPTYSRLPHVCPTHWACGHSHSNPFILSTQTPPLTHGLDWHSSISSSQWSPAILGGQTQTVPPPIFSLQVPLFWQVTRWHSRISTAKERSNEGPLSSFIDQASHLQQKWWKKSPTTFQKLSRDGYDFEFTFLLMRKTLALFWTSMILLIDFGWVLKTRYTLCSYIFFRQFY